MQNGPDPTPAKRVRGFCFTWNNYPDNAEELLAALVTRYDTKFAIAGHEIAPTTGTRHLQGYIYYKLPTTVGAARGRLPGADVRRALGSALQNEQYCRKTREQDAVQNERVWEYGTRPLDQEERGRKGKEHWEAVKKAAQEGRLEDIDAQVYVTQYNTLKRIAKDHMVAPVALEDTCGIWIHGESGVGKSHSVFEKYGADLYLKGLSKWWDGYQGQDTVLVDDMDIFSKGLSKEFKDWGDKYPFHCENKGGANCIRPKKVIVTSQYTPEQIWEDEPTRAAINRRYRLIHKVDRDQLIEFE